LVLGGKAGPAPALYVLSQFTHGLLRDFDAIAPVNRSLCRVDSGEDFRSAALALDPQA